MISLAELIPSPLKHAKILRGAGEGSLAPASRPLLPLATACGEFRTIAYATDLNPEYHIALVRGEVRGRECVLVRMHSRCIYGDVFGSLGCDCGNLLRGSLEAIAEEGAGVLVYLHETG